MTAPKTYHLSTLDDVIRVACMLDGPEPPPDVQVMRPSGYSDKGQLLRVREVPGGVELDVYTGFGQLRSAYEARNYPHSVKTISFRPLGF